MLKKFLEFFGLRGRTFMILVALVLITFGGGIVMIWYTYRMEALFEDVIRYDLASLEAAQDLEASLANEKGLVSYYYADGNPEWLKQLETFREIFTSKLAASKKLAKDPGTIGILDKISSEYSSYAEQKNTVIVMYKSGNREAGIILHAKVREKYFKLLDLCEQYKDTFRKRINLAIASSETRAKRLRFIALSAMSAGGILGALLAFVLLNQILGPIRRLAKEAGQVTVQQSAAGNPAVRLAQSSADEVSALSKRVRGLIQDVDHTHTELERSRQRLFQSEKMALVGKLAAEVAHTIRNPMTSIKMRLFSLERSMELTETQREDLEVVSAEMRHLDNIVHNFLEFSRPPKLKMQRINIADIVDNTIQLLQNQMNLHGVTVERDQHGFLPQIEVDPELIKEVLVNLIVNAVDAIGTGGKIIIEEKEVIDEQLGRCAQLLIIDSGPGIPPSIQDKIWEPFFSTKEDGTGLGLSIAMRIVEEHGGRIAVESGENDGAKFIITLPAQKE